MAQIASELAAELEQQNEAYRSARAALLANAGLTGPKEGEKVASESKLYRELWQSIGASPKLHGFGSAAEARDFLDSARVTGIDDDVFVGCRLYGPKGTLIWRSFPPS